MTRRLSSATERALERIKNGSTAYAAAKAEGIALSTIYRALKRDKQAHEKALMDEYREFVRDKTGIE